MGSWSQGQAVGPTSYGLELTWLSWEVRNSQSWAPSPDSGATSASTPRPWPAPKDTGHRPSLTSSHQATLRLP